MISIGQRLTDQRRRLGLSLEDCEAATHIRGRHLIALEDDRLDDIPDPAYARIYLRGYAAFLGLSADDLAAEFDEARGAPSPLEEHRVVPLDPGPAGRFEELRRWAVQPRRRPPRRATAWVAAWVLTSLALAVWLGARSGGSGPDHPPAARGPTATATSRPAGSIARTTRRRGPPARAELVLAGTGSAGSWVRVQHGGPTGPAVYEGMLGPSRSVRLTVAGALWMRVGWAPSLRVTLGGRSVTLPGSGTGDYLVRPTGITPTA